MPRPLGNKRSLSLPSVPQRSPGGWDRQTVTRAGKARRDVLSPEIGGFTKPFRRRDLPPDRCLHSSDRGNTTGRRSGRTPRLPDEIPVTPRRPAARRSGSREHTDAPGQASLHHRGTEPRSSSEKRRTRVGGAAHRQGSTPRYRAGHHPLPGGSTEVEAPLYRTGPDRAPTSGTADSCQQASITLPARNGAQLRARLRHADRGLLSKPRLARSHRGA